MASDAAETGDLKSWLSELGVGLDEYLKFEHADAMAPQKRWREQLDQPLPQHGVGIQRVVQELVQQIIPNGSPVSRPGFCSFITTGGVSVATLASTAASIASPQRYGHTAFNFLEALSLQWLAQMFGLQHLQGVYSSGGSVANLLALGAARQSAFERTGRDPAAEGVDRPVALYASTEAHHTIQRSAGVLGMGRRAVRPIACDALGRMRPDELERALDQDAHTGTLPVAIVANAGTTNRGAIDPLQAIAAIAHERKIWFHVDGAYGLPGILDERLAPLYAGLERADSVIVDPHKWLGASVGVAATFVRDRELLRRAFTQEPAHYLEGAVQQTASNSPNDTPNDTPSIEHSLDDFGVPYYDMGVELSAPCRGVIVWALLREIGVTGMTARIKRHNQMAADVAKAAREQPHLELLQEPTLSICCFRYVHPNVADLDLLNERLHRRLVRENQIMPSTTRVNGHLALRPCFIGARTEPTHARALIADVLRIGHELSQTWPSTTA